MIKNEIVPVESGELGLMVNSRLLWQQLKVGTSHHLWIGRRVQEYGFVEDRDFCSKLNKNKPGRGRMVKDYVLTLDMAKELAMLENNEAGRMIRWYFIEVEKRYRDWIGFILPRLETDVDLFGHRDGYNYLQLLRACRCSATSGAVGARMRRNPQEFWRNQDDTIFVSEVYGKTIITNAIARRLNAEAKERRGDTVGMTRVDVIRQKSTEVDRSRQRSIDN